MAARRPCISVIFLILALVTAMNVMAQTPPASTSCTSSLSSLSPCSGFLTGAGSATVGPACCSAVATVADDASACLCQLFGTNSPLGFPINQARALILPGLCNVNTPPLTQCSAAGLPGAPPAGGGPAPIPSPAASPPGSSPTVDVLPSPGPSPTEIPPTTGVGFPPVDSPSAPSAGSNPGKPTTGGTPSNSHPITNVGSGADALFTPSAVHLVAGVLLACLCV